MARIKLKKWKWSYQRALEIYAATGKSSDSDVDGTVVSKDSSNRNPKYRFWYKWWAVR